MKEASEAEASSVPCIQQQARLENNNKKEK